MLDVFLTVDVEIWCDGWKDLDTKFPEAFDRYVYGKTARGDYGLPHQLKVLADNGLRAVFFVEPLFSARFGEAPLQEIVGLLSEQGHEIGLHLHTEWVDEAKTPLLPNVTKKMQHLMYFDSSAQTTLLQTGKAMLQSAGVDNITSFRAGSFAFNADTLSALKSAGIPVDSSYNATLFGPESGVAPGQQLTRATRFDEVVEYPMTVFDDGLRGLRHLQFTSCSLSELKHVVRKCAEQELESCVLLSHNFELLTPDKTRPDPFVVKRFESFCKFLSDNPKSFRTTTFEKKDHSNISALRMKQPYPKSSRVRTARRFAEQAARSFYK